MSVFVMPSLGADMETATLVEQLVTPGEAIKRGDVIGAVETQKGVIEIEVFEDGVLEKWLADIGQRIAVGAPLAVLRTDGAAEPVASDMPEPHPGPEPVRVEEAAPATEWMEPVPHAVPQAVPPPKPPHPEGAQTRPRITPAARRLAAQKGIDLSKLDIGADQVLTRLDIERMDGGAADTVASDMRQAIAAAMARSKREIPHYYLSHRIDLTVADALVTATNADRAPQERLLIGAVFAKAVAKALAKFPEFNGHFKDGAFVPANSVHLGMAVHIRSGGLVAPALFDVQDQTVDDLMAAMRDLVGRVRAGRFRARELSDATITLSSLGERGVDQLYGVIYPPQVAILGFGTPRFQPMVIDENVVPRLVVTATLAADHRVSDGHRGGLFLRAIDKHLQSPEAL